MELDMLFHLLVVYCKEFYPHQVYIVRPMLMELWIRAEDHCVDMDRPNSKFLYFIMWTKSTLRFILDLFTLGFRCSSKIPSGMAIPSFCNRFNNKRSVSKADSGILPPVWGSTCSRYIWRFWKTNLAHLLILDLRLKWFTSKRFTFTFILLLATVLIDWIITMKHNDIIWHLICMVFYFEQNVHLIQKEEASFTSQKYVTRIIYCKNKDKKKKKNPRLFRVFLQNSFRWKKRRKKKTIHQSNQ